MGAGAKMGELKRAAQQLGVTSTTLREHGWKTASAGRIEAVKNNPPGWLIEARERRRRKRAGSVTCATAWFQELKYATTDAEAAAIDPRWAREVEQAKREARHLAEEMTPGQVRARIGREQAAAHDAAVYRATQLARRAFGASMARACFRS